MASPEDGAEPEPSRPDYISYAEFGQRFFELAVTRDRVAQALGAIDGRPVEVGPLGVGPMGLVKVRANGAVGTPKVEPREGEHVSYRLMVPVEFEMVIELGLDRCRFTAALRVHVTLTARAAAPLLIVIDATPPTRRDIDVELRGDGLRASVLSLFGVVESELKRAVVKYVRRELDKPELARARVIDVAAALEKLKIGGGS
jgi:hypothetical protein